MIDSTKQYKTRDGRKVRILAMDLTSAFPIVSAVQNDDGVETVMIYPSNGSYYSSELESDYDLIEVKPL